MASIPTNHMSRSYVIHRRYAVLWEGHRRVLVIITYRARTMEIVGKAEKVNGAERLRRGKDMNKTGAIYDTTTTAPQPTSPSHAIAVSHSR
ncbi:hypothetical protein F2Q70_00039608 [Brassica cretica]|uniref:Uncharacterized protein n=1 Tax=Brassica cretica TaxID=69181 RepID=A0A8S9K4G5_BRACR|nr:hypothetical protein F2Q70_00039608 [Brassica cretica]